MTRRDAQGESGWVEVDGVALHHLEYGAGDPAIVVVPGITSPAITWEFVSEQLARDTRVIALDIRGRGLSDHPIDDFSLSRYAADVAGVIAELGLARPVVLGHSMGARIATALGATYPEAVGALIVADPPLTGPGRDPYPTALESFREQLRAAVAGTTAEEVRGFYPRWSERELEIRAEWLQTCDEHAVAETWRNFHTEDFFELWRVVRPPLLFMYGAQSPVVTPSGLAEVIGANPEAQVVGIPGAGHMIPWENLDDFVAAVRNFLTPHLAG